MMLALAMLALAAPDCARFAAAAAAPMSIESEPIASQSLGGPPMPAASATTPAEVRIGMLVYRGHGVALRSADPRFAEIEVVPGRGAFHPCGYHVEGPNGWNALDADRSRWTMRFVPNRHPLPPGTVAFGITPQLADHVAGPSWPIRAASKRYFLGLMHPVDGSDRSVIVTFPDRPGLVPARIVARLPLAVRDLNLTPPLHWSDHAVNLTQRGADGTLRRIVLHLDSKTAEALATP